MDAEKRGLAAAWAAFVRALPGLIVLLVVMLLLRGVSGTAQAAKVQLTTLLTSFLGAGDGIGTVLLHTLPLAIAAAVATFVIASRILTFESFSSFFVLALIILAGASVGGFLRGMIPDSSEQTLVADSTVIGSEQEMASKSTEPQRTIGAIGLPTQSELPSIDSELTSALRMQIVPVDQQALDVIQPPASPLQQLSEIDWLAQPDLEHLPPREIAPLNVLPAISGPVGAVCRAINQLLGYLVAYQPRLFLAAVIAGSWFGWTWQRRWARLHGRADEQDEHHEDEIQYRQAA